MKTIQRSGWPHFEHAGIQAIRRRAFQDLCCASVYALYPLLTQCDRQEMMDDLAIKSGLLPGQPIYPQPLISDKSDFVPFEMVKFAKDEITHAVSVTVSI